MDTRKAYELEKEEIVDRESAYLCTEIERTLDRIITWTDPLDEAMFNKIKAHAIKLLKEWHL
tara:strand:+ start:457 stop:642 length:186 start_codon:yes stop_codon:yes gene_type:complete